MQKYHKINSIFKRDTKGNFIKDEWADPAFGYLEENVWAFTEKIDGTNIRINWDHTEKKVTFGGRTDNAQIPAFLIQKLMELVPAGKFLEKFMQTSITLYGEGYGAKIQKEGSNYIEDGQDFILFDISIGDVWLKRSDVESIGSELSIKVVPIIGYGTIEDAVNKTKEGFNSQWGNFKAEGIVMRPTCELRNSGGHRIITKIKHRDFK